jgi:4-hydroxybenzoate polyprenyltransferase
MLRQYLLLIRLDNTFTSSNILADYFVVVVPATTNILYLTTQMLSSILLYISGIVFNDYFDIDIDLKERKQRTLIIAILSLVVGDISCDYNRFG